jgi:hypothetical protein
MSKLNLDEVLFICRGREEIGSLLVASESESFLERTDRREAFVLGIPDESCA